MTPSNPERGTLAEVVAMTAASISPELADPASAAALRSNCGRLPVDVSTFWGLESRLGEERAAVDLLVEIKRGSPGHSLLAGTIDSPLDSLCGEFDAWRHLRTFARAWAAPGGRLRGLVRNLWLEFDLAAGAAARPPIDPMVSPSVFWGPDVNGTPQPTLDVLDAVAEAFPVFPKDLPRAAVAAAENSLPAGARVFQVGAMQARGAVVLRLCVNRIAPAAVAGWLAEVGWSGDAGALQGTVGALAPLVRTMAVDVDFTASGIGRKVGLECYLDWKHERPAQWEPLLDHLSRLALCCGSKRRALAAFPAKTEYSLRDQMAMRHRGFMCPVIFRNIHHIKVAFDGSRLVEAKAYLGIARPAVNIEQFADGRIPPGIEEDAWFVG